MNRTSHNQGVTLLELAIVLAIIAAIAASVLIGRTMLENSRLQTVMTDADHYIKAIGQFKEAYQALPGDISTATTLWGTDSSGCPYGGGSTGTCNGNADGKIGPYCSGGVPYTSTYGYESFRVWQHLSLAGLVSTSLSPLSTSGFYTVSPGVNIPRGSIENSGFNVMWVDDPALCSNWLGLISGSGSYGNVLGLTSGSTTRFPFSPEQAEGIDKKIDDGYPATGNVRSTDSATPNCLTNTSGYRYNISNSSKLCVLLFLTNF